jgi:hypothetical protein
MAGVGLRMTRTMEAAARDRSGRRSPRLPIELPASIVGRPSLALRLVDLSFSGCLVESARPLLAGLILDLRLDLSGKPFGVKVRVAGSSVDGASHDEPRPRYLVGLEFLSLPAEEELRLRSFLDAEQRRLRARAPAP